jgi:hypothetical protein
MTEENGMESEENSSISGGCVTRNVDAIKTITVSEALKLKSNRKKIRLNFSKDRLNSLCIHTT